MKSYYYHYVYDRYLKPSIFQNNLEQLTPLVKHGFEGLLDIKCILGTGEVTT